MNSSEDRGLDAALKVRKGGCMQSRIRTADLKVLFNFILIISG